MNILEITIKNIQHINSLKYKIDLSKNNLHCIVGKNGIGKTTFIKTIQNFKETNTIDKMSRLNIIDNSSELIYIYDNQEYKFNPIKDEGRFILDSNTPIDENIKKIIFTEFPIPTGKRFNQYSKLIDISRDITAKFASSDYKDKPHELISILNNIYKDDRFNNLECINIKSENYYVLPIDTLNYIREDDFSSGEYMLIQLYKLIKEGTKLIIIDELDISLDSSAQVNLIKELRKLSKKYEINILFTTHSLAIMKMMNDNELFYMETIEDETTITNKSYNYIKNALFNFEGYDKIILTEDKMIINYLNTFLPNESTFHKYTIIDIAGHSQTVDVMEKNKTSEFLGTKKVLTILDGDQKDNTKYQNKEDIKFIPFKSIEKEIYEAYSNHELTAYNITSINQTSIDNANGIGKKSKDLYSQIIDRNYLNFSKVVDFLENKFSSECINFKKEITNFLNLNS